ncbi:pca operon transcription factor PcaQ [Frigidibacter sp. MR17.24]|uniref:pca operon transcription factor PcaQ n=1 Tax=Frigidibacter sp. MR17.24 TaxID=3127345 RepID=UPI003012D2CE
MDARIKLRHLQAFVAITRQQSLKRAAEQLRLTQPAISRTLAELEDILGARLLSRDRGGVTPTAEGAFFFSFAEASLGALDRGISGLGGFARETGLRVRIGMQPSAAAGLGPGLVAALARAKPDLRLELVEGPHDELHRRLRTGELDLLVGRLAEPEQMGDLSFTQLCTEEIACVTRAGHPLLSSSDLQRLVDWPVVYPPQEDAIRPAVRRLLVGAGVPLPPDRIETAAPSFGLMHVLGGDAVWIVPRGLVAAHLAAGRLAALPFDMAATAGPVGMMTRAGEETTAGQRLLLPLLRQVAVSDWQGLASRA